MTIATRAGLIESKIDKLKGATQTALDEKALQARLDELENLVGRLQPPADFIHLARDRGIGGSLEFASAEGLSSMLTELREAFDRDPEALTKGNRFKEVVGRVDALIRDCETTARNLWRRFIEDECASPVKEELLDALDAVPGFVGMTTRIRRLSLAVQSKHYLPWPSFEEFEEFLKDCEALQGAWAELESGDAIPSEVLGFLRSAASAGARLQDLTTEVFEWLRAHEVEEAFRIRAVGDE